MSDQGMSKKLMTAVILVLITISFSGCVMDGSTTYHYYGIESATVFDGDVNNTKSNLKKVLKGLNKTSYKLSSINNCTNFESKMKVGIPPNTTSKQFSFKNHTAINLGIPKNMTSKDINTQIYISDTKIVVFGLYKDDVVTIEKKNYNKSIRKQFRNDKNHLNKYLIEIYDLIEEVYGVKNNQTFYRLMVDGPVYAD